MEQRSNESLNSSFNQFVSNKTPVKGASIFQDKNNGKTTGNKQELLNFLVRKNVSMEMEGVKTEKHQPSAGTVVMLNMDNCRNQKRRVRVLSPQSSQVNKR